MQIDWVRKYYIRQINLDAKRKFRYENYSIERRTINRLKSIFLNSLNEQKELIQLRKLPRYRLTQNPKLMQRFNGELKDRYVDVNKIPINLVTTKSVLARKKQLATEITMIQK